MFDIGVFNFLSLYRMVPPEIALLFFALRNQHRREKNDTILPLLLAWLPARHSNSAPSQQGRHATSGRRRQADRRQRGRVPSDQGKDAQNQREHHEEDDEANPFLWLAHVEEVGR